jgi:hypothetical protein
MRYAIIVFPNKIIYKDLNIDFLVAASAGDEPAFQADSRRTPE